MTQRFCSVRNVASLAALIAGAVLSCAAHGYVGAMESRHGRTPPAYSQSLAPGQQPFAQCFDEASRMYGVSAVLLRAIAKVESGFNPRAYACNKNGTCDIGVMQINTSWLETLARWDITKEDLFDACTNIKIGAWIASGLIAKHGLTWDAVGGYNAGCKNKSKASCMAIRAPYTWKVYNAMTAMR